MSGPLSAGTVSDPNPRPFIAETLVSAGPRKRGTDNSELCEDCIGICWFGDRLLFWLCDGSSEEEVLPRLPVMPGEDEAPPAFGFSARTLAKEAGNAFAEYLCRLLQEGTDIMAGGAFPAGAFSQVAAVWEERLGRYISLEEKRGRLAGFLERFPQVNLNPEVTAQPTLLVIGAKPRARRCSIRSQLERWARNSAVF